jgi:hypothetical protein
MSSTLKVLVQGLFRDYHNAWNSAIGAGVGAVVGVISGPFKSKKMKKPEHLLVNKIECLHLQHLLRESRLAGRDASLALSIPTRKHSGS